MTTLGIARLRPASRRRVAALAGALLLAPTVFALAGCAAPDPESTEGGMGLPTVEWLTEQPADAGEVITGTLAVADNGCFQVATADATLFVVWPEGFEHGGAEVVTASGSRIAAGDAVEGSGVVLDVPAVLELSDGPDGAMGSALSYCAAQTDVAVLAEVSAPQ